MGKSRWWVTAAAGALVVGLFTPTPSIGSAVPAAADGTPIADPYPDKPLRSSLGLVLEEHHQFPASEPTPAPTDYRLMRHNRINYIGDIPDGTRRQYVPDLNGPLYLLDRGREHRYLDIKAQFPSFYSGRGMGSGFGFVSFHPDFEDNGLFYTVHTEKTADMTTLPATTYPAQTPTFSHSVVTEWTARNPDANVFRGTRREVLRLGFASQIHAIQQIDFNPTAEPRDDDYGQLYVAIGDGGIGLTTDQPQTLDNPYGKIWRIDPRGTDGPTGSYGVPRSNPFVGDAGALGETWAIGMRDPHRFSWDPQGQHRMYLGHIGQHQVEAVYEVRPGDNFGWNPREGRFVYDNDDQCNLYPLPADDAQHGYVYPVAAYDHDAPAGWPCTSDSGHGISGGQVYRGKLPALRGKYVFGDLVDGRVLWAQAGQMRQETGREATLHEMQLWTTDGERLRMTDLVDDHRVDLRFGVDAKGELYLLAKANGKVWKVVGTRNTPWKDETLPALSDSVVAAYDFEHPFAVDGAKEEDQGPSRTLLDLVNGGEDMRVRDGAYPGSRSSIQTQQVNPTVAGNDDWKAGVWGQDGVASLDRFAGAEQATVMGWFKMNGTGPALNSTTPDPTDRYNAIGLAGVLAGNSDGHGVRALLELINVDGELKLVALGRRLDDGSSSTYAASADWRSLLPRGRWVHLAATFDYTTGEMALYRNGKPVDGFYTSTSDPWQVDGTGTSDTLPRGIKIGGSFPQNTLERNPCDCRMDSLVFLDKAASAGQVRQQYRRYLAGY